MNIEKKFVNYSSYLGYFVSLLFTLIGCPLALKLVEPNGIYGVRIPSTYQSAEAWYAINFAAGWALITVSLISIGLIFMLQHHWNSSAITSVVLSSLVPVFLPVVALAVVVLAMTS